MQIKELAKICSVSVRTLHYYDEIGLLSPASVDEQNGYRFYDENSLERMQEILFYRELDFPLKSIAEILSAPNYNKQLAISRQKQLLTLKKERLERLINALEIAMNGGNIMNFNEFDNSTYESTRKAYENEAKEKWGKTSAFQEFTKKSTAYTNEKKIEINAAMENIISEFSICKSDGNSPDSNAAQVLVKKWHDFISDNFYSCTMEILSQLGQMYCCDERFKNSFDKHGEGTAMFVSNAIEFYCK